LSSAAEFGAGVVGIGAILHSIGRKLLVGIRETRKSG
jgi:hypothetical protein